MRVIDADDLDVRPGGVLFTYRTRFPIAVALFIPAGFVFEGVINFLPEDGKYLSLILLVTLLLVIGIAFAVTVAWILKNTRERRWLLYVGPNGLYVRLNPGPPPETSDEPDVAIHLEFAEVKSVQRLKRAWAFNWAIYRPEPGAGDEYLRIELARDVSLALSRLLSDLTSPPQVGTPAMSNGAPGDPVLVLGWKGAHFSVAPSTRRALYLFGHFGIAVRETLVLDVLTFLEHVNALDKSARV